MPKEPKAICVPVPRLAFKQYEAAEAVGLKRGAFRREVVAGKIKPMTNGNFALAELERYTREETTK